MCVIHASELYHARRYTSALLCLLKTITDDLILFDMDLHKARHEAQNYVQCATDRLCLCLSYGTYNLVCTLCVSSLGCGQFGVSSQLSAGIISQLTNDVSANHSHSHTCTTARC